eukprot:COSAG01_NODE_2644_length_7322_cov_10.222899_4_plen_678_part_00
MVALLELLLLLLLLMAQLHPPGCQCAAPPPPPQEQHRLTLIHHSNLTTTVANLAGEYGTTTTALPTATHAAAPVVAPAPVCDYTVVVVNSGANYAAVLLGRWLSAAGQCELPVVSGASTAPLQITVAVRDGGALPVEALCLRATAGAAGGAVSFSLTGGSSRGVNYAACEFLEQIVGFEFLAKNTTVVPHLAAMPQRPAGWSFISEPAFAFRSLGFAEVLRESGADFAVTVRDNSIDWKDEPKPGGGIYYANPPGGVHSAFRLIPPARWQESHPDWFGGYVFDTTGVRVATQLCWAAPGLVAQLIDAVRTDLRFGVNSNATIISVSQNDGGTYCNSSAELAVIEQEGSPSGPLLRAVNAVADAIAVEFPRVSVDTLAYAFTIVPPKFTKPQPNVVVRIGTMGANFRLPLTHNDNAKVREAIVGWSRIAPRLWVWSYLVNFPNYVSPWPNYQVIGPNLRFLQSFNVSGVYGEGDGYARGSDLAELKAWLTAKLLWDPAQDDATLTGRFLRAYYGAAVAPSITEYMELFETAANATATVLDPEDNCLPGPPVCDGKMQYLLPETLLRSVAIFQKATRVVEADAAKQLRLAVAELPTLYVILLRWQYVRAWAKAHKQPWPLSPNITVVYEGFAKVYRVHGMDKGVWCDKPGEECASPQRDNALGEWTGAGLKWFKKQIGA